MHSPSLGNTSIFDPTQQTSNYPCTTDGFGNAVSAGSRNQNIYTTRITDGLFAGSPGNAKPLSNNVQHAFTIFVQNALGTTTLYHLSFAPLPANTVASFEQFANPPTTTIDVNIPPHSTATRTVFVTAPPHTRIDVLVTQDGGALTATISLDPDPTNPDNSAIATNETFNPDVANPDVANPDVANPDVANPDVANPDVANPDVANPDVANPDVANPDVANPDVANPDVANPDVANNSMTDTTWTTKDNGNAIGGYTVKLFKNGDLPPGVKSQLILNKLYDTPVARSCDLGVEHNRQIITSIKDPTLITDINEFTNPSLTDPSVKNATMWLAPGETGRITVRLASATPGLTLDASQFVTPVVIAHSANTGSTQPSTSAPPLAITTTSLPDGTRVGMGVPVPDYNYTLTTIGGFGARTWSVTPALPTRLFLNPSTGVIAGPVSETVDQDYTFSVMDSANPPKSASKVLHLRTAPPLVITTQSIPNATVTQPYSTTISATGGRPPYTWSIKAPSQLSINQNGVISGIFDSPNSSFVTVTVTDSGSPQRIAQKQYDFAAVYPTITSITPSPAAAGYGQLVALNVANLTTTSNVSVTLSDGATTNSGFVFQSPSTPQRIFVRLPFVGDNNGTTTNLMPGNLAVALLNGAQQLATSQMTLSTTPGAPVIQFVMGLSVPPADNTPCGTLDSTAAINVISPRQGIAVSALGVDTVGATLAFTQGNNDPIFVQWSCAYSSSGFGVAPVFTVPSNLANGPVSVTMMTTVNNVSSAASAPITLTVVSPTYACIGNQITLFDNWTKNAVLNGGAAPSFSTNGQTYCLDEIDDYHWNDGAGKVPGTIGLTSVCEFNCTTIGPYPAVGSPGQNNAPNVNWTMKPPSQIVINGNYSVADSDPATWSYDPTVSTLGFSKVFVHTAVVTTPPPPSP